MISKFQTWNLKLLETTLSGFVFRFRNQELNQSKSVPRFWNRKPYKFPYESALNWLGCSPLCTIKTNLLYQLILTLVYAYDQGRDKKRKKREEKANSLCGFWSDKRMHLWLDKPYAINMIFTHCGYNICIELPKGIGIIKSGDQEKWFAYRLRGHFYHPPYASRGCFSRPHMILKIIHE